MPSPAVTFFNDPANKAGLVKAGYAHRELDRLRKGRYEPDDCGRCCDIGCYFGGEHKKALDLHGIPLRVAHFADAMFELLPEPMNIEWHTQWVEAIPVGATDKQITLAMDRLQLFSLRQKAEWYGDGHNHRLKVMIGLFDRAVHGDDPTADEWDRAARDAWAARDEWDAWAAWAAWDERAARAEWDAWAAWAAWDKRAARAAINTHYTALRDEFFKEMSAIRSAT